MTAPALLVALVLFQSPVPPAPPLAPEAVLPLLGRVPAFAAASGRTDLKLTQKAMAIPGSDGRAHFVEFQWADAKGSMHAGVAMVVHKSFAGQVKRWQAEGDPWGIAEVFEDKTWDDLVSDLKRARLAANEAIAVGDTRALISAEYVFQTASAGSFGALRCLARPADCLPGYKGPAFLDATLTDAAEKNGYRRQLVPGPAAGDGKSPDLLKTFAYTAVPVTPGETGQRSFCGDSTGRVCMLVDGGPPEVKAGACAPSCPEMK